MSKPGGKRSTTMIFTDGQHRRGALCGLALLFALPAAGQAATRTYIVTDFDSLRVEGPIEVAVVTGRGVSARGEGERAALERIDLKVSARVLTVRLRPAPFESRRDGAIGSIRLTLTVPALRRLQMSGAGTLRAQGLHKGRAEVIASGSGTVDVGTIDADAVSVVQLGSGSVRLSGKAASLTMRVSGGGAIDAGGLVAADLDLTLEGAATVEARAERTAKVIAVGPGSATIHGRPACTVRRLGSGTVRCGDTPF
jgi:hypothetical protein